jgi:hypothetical protein
MPSTTTSTSPLFTVGLFDEHRYLTPDEKCPICWDVVPDSHCIVNVFCITKWSPSWCCLVIIVCWRTEARKYDGKLAKSSSTSHPTDRLVGKEEQRSYAAENKLYRKE